MCFLMLKPANQETAPSTNLSVWWCRLDLNFYIIYYCLYFEIHLLEITVQILKVKFSKFTAYFQIILKLNGYEMNSKLINRQQVMK